LELKVDFHLLLQLEKHVKIVVIVIVIVATVKEQGNRRIEKANLQKAKTTQESRVSS
jgi:hypothetical protein